MGNLLVCRIGDSYIMHVISRRTLLDFAKLHPDADMHIRAWYHEAVRATWRHSADIKARFPSASIISSERVVFNLMGSRYRLVTRINYGSGVLFVRFIGTHAEYNSIDVRRV